MIHSFLRALILTMSASALWIQPSAVLASTQIPVEFEKDSRVPIVYLNLVVNGGSVHDPVGKEGLTQLMGEMMLRGTTLRSKAELDLALDQIGASLAVETRAEALIFRGAVLSKDLQSFLEILEEVATSPRFDSEEIGKLKTEANAALLSEMGRDASIITRKFSRFLFNGSHPYGAPINGSRSSLPKITKDDLVLQHKRFLQSANLTLIALGDAERRSLDSFAIKLSRRLIDHTALARVSAPTPTKGRSILLIDKPERTQCQVMGGQLGVTLDHPDYFPLYLGNFAFGGGSFNSRMMQEIRVKRGWSYGAYSAFRHGLEPRSWIYNYAPATKDCVAATRLGVELVESLKANGILENEYQTARESLINSAAFMSNTPQKRAENRILEVTLNLRPGFMERYRPELEKTTLKEVNAALNRFLKPDDLRIAVLGDAKKLAPEIQKELKLGNEQIQTVNYDSD